MRNLLSSAGIVLALAAASLLTGCGNFWKAPGSGGTGTGTTATTTALSPSTSTPTVGSSVILTATVSPSTATGTVTFYDNSASIGTGTLDTGMATLTTTFSAAGTESLTASYGGSTTYATSTSTAVTVTVSAESSSARIGQPVRVKSLHTTGYGSAPIHALGAFQAAGADFSAQDAEAVVVEGGGSVTLTNTTLSSAAGAGRGILFSSSSPDAARQEPARFTMTGGAIAYRCAGCSTSATSGGQNQPTAVFSVANAKAAIVLTDVAVTNNSATGSSREGVLLSAGRQGARSAAAFTARGTTLTGDVLVGTNGEAAFALLKDDAGKGSSLTGAINTGETKPAASGPENAAGDVSLTLDASSQWTVTAASHLNSLSGLDVSGGTVTNIDGGGHCVFYSGAVNEAGGNAVYALSGGGFLAPEGTTGLICR